MDVILTYAELSDYVLRHFNQRVELMLEGEHSIRAVYRKGILSKSVNLRVATVEDNCLTIAFDGGAMISMLISSFRSAINEKLGNGIKIFKNHYLIVDLRLIPQTQTLAAAVDIKEVTPTDSAIIIKADLK